MPTSAHFKMDHIIKGSVLLCMWGDVGIAPYDSANKAIDTRNRPG